MRYAVFFFFITVALVFAGCFLYIFGYAGWAQLCWVLASGTAGASVVIWIDYR